MSGFDIYIYSVLEAKGKKCLGSPENKDTGYIIENDDVQELLEVEQEAFITVFSF